MTLQELRDQRGNLVAQMRALVERGDANGKMTQEDENQFDKLFEEQNRLDASIKRHENLAELERQAASQLIQNPEAKKANQIHTAMDGFRGWLQFGNGYQGPGADQFKALQADQMTGGGYLVAPEEFVANLIQAIDDQTFIRKLATVYTLNGAHSLGFPALDNNPSDSDWTSELATGSEDTTMSVGKRELKPHPLAKRIKVSNRLLNLSTLPVEQIVMNKLAYKFAITEEKAFLTGNGSDQPLGLFTASTNGISTGRDIATDNTTTAMTLEGLKNAKYGLKGQYLPKAQWLFHRDGVKQISKIREGAGTGQFLWEPSNQAGEPDRLLGLPVNISEYVPNTFTTGLYVGMLGDFSQYWIADSLKMEMQKLVELYAESNTVGYIGRLETDGMPVLEEAFVRVKLG